MVEITPSTQIKATTAFFFLIVAWVVFLVWQFSIKNNPWIATFWGPSTLRYQLSPEKSWIRPWEDDWRRDLDGE